MEKERENSEFEFAGYVKEYHDKPLYDVQFCHYFEQMIFATVGSNKVTIYECQDEMIKLLKCYQDENKTENYYCCAWSYYPDSCCVVLAAAGLHGIVRIIYPNKNVPAKFLKGHGDAINDIKFHPNKPSLLISASKDHSLRLWNVESNVCIAIFGGVDGHTNEIATVDFHCQGDQFISAGVDTSLKIWRLDTPPIKKQIDESFSTQNKDQNSIRPLKIHFPNYSTERVHPRLIDCVKWLGDLILSKTVDSRIVCWKPPSHSDASIQPRNPRQIVNFELDSCGYWYVRFSFDTAKKYLAIGNSLGKIYLWSLQSENPTEYTMLSHNKCVTTVRQTAFSRDAKILLYVCEDSTIWRWNKKAQS